MKLSNYSKIFKALANEQRLKIFLMICEKGSCCVGGSIDKAFTMACGCMNLSRSTISHHFKELENAGLITSVRDGQSFSCKVNKEVVNSIKELLK